ncbi:sugar phosphate isomerase/epimerase [Aeoliella sp. ICT_H6.2]|uniref:Sugar phosphate isomerase/epimerase n=1 Tax=Aeoliella straminimaris TaxID=2954799 RepID=A0A9X2FGS9_9BACT|nr:sugar phosphate isomerase/epimerase family protein [Aeoliella straminimaris]MCO6046219.1 sugar phosphate isomerase/epimerase [Aeoliella straminimaris]
MDRRKFLQVSAAAWGCQLASRVHSAEAATPPRYRIGVCDWMILKRQKLGAFALAEEIGADGLEVDMGSLGGRETFDSKLSDAAVRKQFLAESRARSVEICSLAMSGFYAQSFAERPTVPRMVGDCLQTMVAMGVRVAFLPLGVQGDLIKHPELRPKIVERLKRLAPKAEEANAVIGLETALPAEGEAALIDEIDSPAVRSYFNFANALQAGRDLHKELETLGRDRICQIHCTDQDGVLLRDNERLDMQAAKHSLDSMKWSGWLVVERSRDASDARNVRRNFGENVRYLKQVFQSEVASIEAC